MWELFTAGASDVIWKTIGKIFSSNTTKNGMIKSQSFYSPALKPRLTGIFSALKQFCFPGSLPVSQTQTDKDFQIKTASK